MKIYGILIICSTIFIGITHGTFCPTFCKCSLEGVSGINAYCAELDPDKQFFLKPVQHLTITNENKSQIALTDNIFSKLGLKKLESIKIVNSLLSNISVDAFRGLSSLFDVDLSDNRLFLIHPETFAQNTNLHRLKLSGNPLQLTQLLQTPHDYLLRSSSVIEFDISNCQLSQVLPLTFSQLRNLAFVKLGSNYLKTIRRDVFADLEYLEELDLSNNLITNIEKDAFKNNRDLSVLKLRKNPIELLKGINIPKLEELDLSDCKLKILMRETLEGMSQIIQLNLSYNQIEILSDDAFSDLTALTHLDLSYNNITGPLPRGIFQNNKELETLTLKGNRDLKTLVEGEGFVENHLALLRLDIGSCSLTLLTAKQFEGLSSLSILIANQNSIKHLDADVFHKLRRLTHLDLSHNLIETLEPHLFTGNSELNNLILSGNPLIELPVLTFIHVPNLRLLHVSNCHLQRLWNNYKHALKQYKVLSNLVYLDLSGNSIKNLHVADFVSLDKLEKIDLSNNPLECLKTTIEVIELFMKKQVDPYHPKEIVKTAAQEKTRWNNLIMEMCPVKVVNILETTTVTEKVIPDDVLYAQVISNHAAEEEEIIQHMSKTYDLNEIVVESDNSFIWPIVFVVSVIIVIIYLIVYFVGEIINRRRAVAAYIKPGSLGGHIRTRGTGGSPLYYKLYEECSIPDQSVNKKKPIVFDFTPIHALIKKESYRIMKNKTNNEVNV